MTVQEMHIGIDFLLQKVNSNITKTFRPEEKDWALNEEVIRFINQKSSSTSNPKKTGLEETEKRYDDIRNLITTTGINGNPPLLCYPRDTNSVFSYLPADYFTLINDRSLTKNLCGLPYNNSNVPVTPKNYYICIFPVLDDNIDLYSAFQVSINGLLIFDLATFGGSLPSSKSKFYIINNLIQVLNNLPNTLPGISAKYENYFDMSVGGNIIVVSNSISITNIQVKYVGSLYTYYPTIKTFLVVNTPSSYNEVPNRLSKTEDIYVLLSSSFCNTLWDCPLTIMEGGKLVGFHNQNFILSNFNISYIRKPKKIDLTLNIGCELSESVHQEIVDNTATRLAGITSSEAYQQILNENNKKE